MGSTMTTHNVGRHTAATRGGGTSEQDGREVERSKDQVGSGRGSQEGGRGGQAQVGNHINNQRNNKNQDDNVVNDNNQGNVRTMNNGRGGCSYKEFMACNLKDYDGKGGVIVYTRWIEKMESVQDMSGEELCPNNEMQKLETKFWCHAMVKAGYAVYIDRFHELDRLDPYLVTPEYKRIDKYIYGLALQIRVMVAATEPTTIQSDVVKARMLTDKAIRNGALKKVTEKRRNNGEPSRD
ncbi:hypothetical protein Tco_1430672, partial [Tanacetum coccineum]